MSNCKNYRIIQENYKMWIKNYQKKSKEQKENQEQMVFCNKTIWKCPENVL